MQYEKLSKKALACMYVKTAVRVAIIVISMFLVMLLFQEEWAPVVQRILYGIIGIEILYLLIAPKIRYECYRYALTQEEFEVRKGLITIKTEIVPIERLHKIEVSSGPVFRAFGLKEVVATTAGSDIRVSYLDNAVAEQIARHLKTRINSIVVEERNSSAAENTKDVDFIQNESQAQNGGSDEAR